MLAKCWTLTEVAPTMIGSPLASPRRLSSPWLAPPPAFTTPHTCDCHPAVEGMVDARATTTAISRHFADAAARCGNALQHLVLMLNMLEGWAFDTHCNVLAFHDIEQCMVNDLKLSTVWLLKQPSFYDECM